MNFLTPIFLAGLAAIAVPIWFHLIRREQSSRVPFSSVMYVPRKEMRQVRRQKLRQWPLCLLRLLLIVLLVLALSRPYWPELSAGWSSGSQARVVLLDNSFSVRAGNRWLQAKQLAEREVRSAPAGSEVSLALVSDRVEFLGGPPEPVETMLSKLRQAEPSYRATRLDQGIRAAGDMLKQSRMVTREIVLISDFQKNGLYTSSWNIPEGIGLRTHSLPETAGNLFIEDVQAPREMYEKSPREDIKVQLRNNTPSEAKTLRLVLKIQDLPEVSQVVSIPAFRSRTASFQAPEIKDASVVKCEARLEAADAIADDNRFYFTMRRRDKVPVILAASGPAATFLGQALNSEGLPWTVKAGLTEEWLRKSKALILHDPIEIPQFVASWVKGGGGLLIFSGPQGDSLRSDLLPVKPQENRIARRGRDQGMQLDDVQWQHPAFAPFADQQKRYFASVHFYGYTAASALPDTKILARFDSDNPVLVERSYGRGKVLWFASSVSNEWNDFALRPAFLPFVQQVTAYLAGLRKSLGAPRVGARVDLSAWGEGEVTPIDPRGRRVETVSNSSLLDVELPGFYEIRFNRTSDFLSVNIPASESILDSEPVQQIQARAGRIRASVAQVSAATAEHRQSWWRVLLLLAALLLLGEWVLADLYYGRIQRLRKAS
jgi:hypothetical protein